MKGTEVETILDESGIQLIVTYDYEKVPYYMDYDGVDVEVKNVRIVIADIGIDIFPLMNDRQIQAVINNLCINF